MNKVSVGRGMIIAAAVFSVVIPFTVDMIVQADLHMENEAWLPHAKLHTAMSVHAAIALGAGSLALLAVRRKRTDVADLAIAAFLGTAFWVGLLLSGLWPGTAYSTADVPTSADAMMVIGDVPIDGNVAMAVVTVALGWLGFAVAASGLGRADRSSGAPVPAPASARHDVDAALR